MDANVKPRLMGLDVSRRRLGIAVSDSLWLAAQPRAVLQRTSRRADFDRLCRFVRKEGIERIVCGLPVWQGRADHRQAQYVREWALRFVQAQRILLPQARPVIFWDEQYTSAAARYAQRTQAGLEGLEDAVAAALVLEAYMRGQDDAAGPALGRIEA